MKRLDAHAQPTAFTPHDWADAWFTGPHYDPPYAGALQDELAWHLVKYLREDAVLRSETSVERPGSLFTLDFVIEAPRADGSVRRVGLECGDGRSVRDRQRRWHRDASVMATGHLDALVRLRGTDLLHHIHDALYLMSQRDPDLFSERGRINLRTLSSPEARTLRLRDEQVEALVLYALDPEGAETTPERHLWHIANGQVPHVLVRRLSQRHPETWAGAVLEQRVEAAASLARAA